MEISHRPPTPVAYILIAFIGILPGLSMILGAAVGPTILYEWAENLGLIIALAFGFLSILHHPRGLLKDGSNKILIVAGAASLIWMLVSIHFLAANPASAILGTLMLVCGLGAGLVVYDLATVDQEKIFRWTLLAFFLGNICTVAMPLLIAVLGDPPAPFQFWTHTLPGFGGVRRMGHFSTLAACSGVALYLMSPRSGWQRPAILIGLSLIFAITFWGGARATVLALLTAIPLSLAITGTATIREWFMIAASFVTGAGISLVLPLPHSSFGAFQRIANTGYAMNKSNGITTGRTEIWAWCIEQIRSHPWTGIGYNQIAILGKPPLKVYHAHNVIFELLLGFGLVFGTIMVLFIAGLCLKAVIRSWGSLDTRQAAGLMLVFSMGIYAMMCATLYYPIPLIGFSIGLAMAIKPRGDAPSPSPKQR